MIALNNDSDEPSDSILKLMVAIGTHSRIPNNTAYILGSKIRITKRGHVIYNKKMERRLANDKNTINVTFVYTW